MTQEERDERDKKMVDDWLKNNEPSVKIKHGEKMPHLPQIAKIKSGD